jgi:hypothetical protein
MGESQPLKPQIGAYRNALFGAVPPAIGAEIRHCGPIGFWAEKGSPSRSHNALIWINLDTVGSRCTQARPATGPRG